MEILLIYVPLWPWLPLYWFYPYINSVFLPHCYLRIQWGVWFSLYFSGYFEVNFFLDVFAYVFESVNLLQLLSFVPCYDQWSCLFIAYLKLFLSLGFGGNKLTISLLGNFQLLFFVTSEYFASVHDLVFCYSWWDNCDWTWKYKFVHFCKH